MSETGELPWPGHEVDAYIKRTGHTFGLEHTMEDGYVVLEFDRHDVRIDQRVLGRFPDGVPERLVVEAMKGLAGV